MPLPHTISSDDELRALLWRAARDRMDAVTAPSRAAAGQVCLDVVGELQRRAAPLWCGVDGSCGCGCGAVRGDALTDLSAPHPQQRPGGAVVRRLTPLPCAG